MWQKGSLKSEDNKVHGWMFRLSYEESPITEGIMNEVESWHNVLKKAEGGMGGTGGRRGKGGDVIIF